MSFHDLLAGLAVIAAVLCVMVSCSAALRPAKCNCADCRRAREDQKNGRAS